MGDVLAREGQAQRRTSPALPCGYGLGIGRKGRVSSQRSKRARRGRQHQGIVRGAGQFLIHPAKFKEERGERTLDSGSDGGRVEGIGAQSEVQLGVASGSWVVSAFVGRYHADRDDEPREKQTHRGQLSPAERVPGRIPMGCPRGLQCLGKKLPCNCTHQSR